MDSKSQDEDQIRTLIARQFDALSWDKSTQPDWELFMSDFLQSAHLFPSARPVVPATVSTFVERMKGLSASSLESFQEEVLGTRIHVFGGVAVAVVACEVTENQKDVSRTVEMMLFGEAGRRLANSGPGLGQGYADKAHSWNISRE